MQEDGKGWLFVPSGLQDGPFPTHYEPQESPFSNPLYELCTVELRSAAGCLRSVGRRRAAGGVAAALGPLVATYTAGLVANTAVPVWQEARPTLPFVFAGGSMARAGSAGPRRA